jgi:hypothetical protein
MQGPAGSVADGGAHIVQRELRMVQMSLDVAAGAVQRTFLLRGVRRAGVQAGPHQPGEQFHHRTHHDGRIAGGQRRQAALQGRRWSLYSAAAVPRRAWPRAGRR